MATDSIKNSSDEEISFSEWQFVVKNKGECSDDDESIEIIEREVLRSVTPSSCSEDENDNENEKENDDEIELMDWEVSDDGRVHFYDNESNVNSSIEVDSDQTANNCLSASEDSHVAATTINNHFSRKVLYSCVLAAVISVVIHQYRGNLLDMLNRVYAKSEVSEPTLQDAALDTQAELKNQITDFEFLSGHEKFGYLLSKRHQFKKHCKHYELILRNTFISKNYYYVMDFSVLQEAFFDEHDSLEEIESPPCKTTRDRDRAQSFCTDSSGKLLLFLDGFYHRDFMRKVLDAMQFDESNNMRKVLNYFRWVCRRSSAFRPAWRKSEDSEVLSKCSNDRICDEINPGNILLNELFDDSMKDDTTASKTVEMDVPEVRENLNKELPSEINLENIQTNELFDDSMKDDTAATKTVEIDVPEVRENRNKKLSSEINLENIQTNELSHDSMEDDTAATNTAEMDVPEIRKNPVGVESQIQEIIEEIRTLGQKIKTQVDDFHRLWTTCNKNEPNSCVSKNESPEQNVTSTTESQKFNVTRTEETNSASVSDFIYKTVPVTDRWSAKVDFKPSKDSKYQEKANGEWLLKLGKAREKYRNKRYKEKGFKKKTHKSNEKEKPVHEMYKRYREFITRTREKIKVDYKKYASQFKSKLKKFGDGMKRSYEKFISSDWKHYAKSVFFPFHF